MLCILQFFFGGNGGLKVVKIVVVNFNGINGDVYKIINDVIVVVLMKVEFENGYFVIYVVVGVYEEYVMVFSNKLYVMIIGDGIDKIIIIGNRNVVDGFIIFVFVILGKLLVNQILFKIVKENVKYLKIDVEYYVVKF